MGYKIHRTASTVILFSTSRANEALSDTPLQHYEPWHCRKTKKTVPRNSGKVLVHTVHPSGRSCCGIGLEGGGHDF